MQKNINKNNINKNNNIIYYKKNNNKMQNKNNEKKNCINLRINFIKELLHDKDINLIVNYDNNETENFISPVIDNNNNYKKYNENSETNSSNDSSSTDSRFILNKKSYDFYDVVRKIGGQLEYIKSGSTGHTFKGNFKSNNIDVNYAVKVVAYPKKSYYGDMHDIRRPENAELKMIKTLSYFVVKKQTPHIILPICTFNTKITPFVNLIDNGIIDENNKKYYEFVEKYKKNYYHDTVSILISEWANRQDFLDFVRKNYKQFTPKHWKTFFFQIISVLAIIQYKFPSFRHNDLKANNILVDVDKNYISKPKFRYTINGYVYTIPNIGYQIKIWDFDFSCIPGLVDNAKVSADWTDEINIKPIKNRYYDMHYFFNTFIKKGFFPDFMTESCIPDEAKNFINRIIPKIYQTGKYTSKRGRILINDEILVPDQVLKKDPYFQEFRTKKLIN